MFQGKIRRFFNIFRRFIRSQRGISLVENLVAVGILAAIGVLFMTSMQSATNNVDILDENLKGEILVRSQLEDIKNADYSLAGNYPITVEVPVGYSMTIDVQPPSCIGTSDNCTPLETLMGQTIDSIQEITVTLYHHEETVVKVACYKAQQ